MQGHPHTLANSPLKTRWEAPNGRSSWGCALPWSPTCTSNVPTLLGATNIEEVRTVFGNASTPSHCLSCVMSVCMCVFSHTPCFCTQYVRTFMMPNMARKLFYGKNLHFFQEADGC